MGIGERRQGTQGSGIAPCVGGAFAWEIRLAMPVALGDKRTPHLGRESPNLPTRNSEEPKFVLAAAVTVVEKGTGNMIVDLLSNWRLYRGLNARIDRAFEYLRQTDLAALEPGSYEIDGKIIYARVMNYNTRPAEQGVWEAHRRYIDLQVVAAGVERIGYAPVSRLAAGAYDEAKDFVPLSGNGDLVTLSGGSFMLLWPSDGHMPCLAVDAPTPVKKIVIKIAVE